MFNVLQRFEYQTADIPNIDRAALKQEIISTLTSHDMAPAYEEIFSSLDWAVDAAELERMHAANAARLKELDAKIKDAEENLGEMEVRDALQAKADYLATIDDRTAAVEAYAATEAKTAGAGPKLDVAFAQLRLHIAHGDWYAVKAGIERAQELCAQGGDWERKNRLRVYEAVHLMATRQFQRAAKLFLDCIATFTATELMTYHRCVFYTVVLAVVTLDRSTVKSEVVDNPEILSVIDSIPHLHAFLDSFYGARYADYFEAFVGISDAIRADRYLNPHYRFYSREARIVAYSQFLESYKSVALGAMATAFGVTPEFLDGELADFIAGGRLPAKIDRVAMVAETNRPDAKNALYQATIRQGDHLLNKLQKLFKVMDAE